MTIPEAAQKIREQARRWEHIEAPDKVPSTYWIAKRVIATEVSQFLEKLAKELEAS